MPKNEKNNDKSTELDSAVVSEKTPFWCPDHQKWEKEVHRPNVTGTDQKEYKMDVKKSSVKNFGRIMLKNEDVPDREVGQYGTRNRYNTEMNADVDDPTAQAGGGANPYRPIASMDQDLLESGMKGQRHQASVPSNVQNSIEKVDFGRLFGRGKKEAPQQQPKEELSFNHPMNWFPRWLMANPDWKQGDPIPHNAYNFEKPDYVPNYGDPAAGRGQMPGLSQTASGGAMEMPGAASPASTNPERNRGIGRVEDTTKSVIKSMSRAFRLEDDGPFLVKESFKGESERGYDPEKQAEIEGDDRNSTEQQRIINKKRIQAIKDAQAANRHSQTASQAAEEAGTDISSGTESIIHRDPHTGSMYNLQELKDIHDADRRGFVQSPVFKGLSPDIKTHLGYPLGHKLNPEEGPDPIQHALLKLMKADRTGEIPPRKMYTHLTGPVLHPNDKTQVHIPPDAQASLAGGTMESHGSTQGKIKPVSRTQAMELPTQQEQEAWADEASKTFNNPWQSQEQNEAIRAKGGSAWKPQIYQNSIEKTLLKLMKQGEHYRRPITEEQPKIDFPADKQPMPNIPPPHSGLNEHIMETGSGRAMPTQTSQTIPYLSPRLARDYQLDPNPPVPGKEGEYVSPTSNLYRDLVMNRMKLETGKGDNDTYSNYVAQDALRSREEEPQRIDQPDLRSMHNSIEKTLLKLMNMEKLQIDSKGGVNMHNTAMTRSNAIRHNENVNEEDQMNVEKNRVPMANTGPNMRTGTFPFNAFGTGGGRRVPTPAQGTGSQQNLAEQHEAGKEVGDPQQEGTARMSGWDMANLAAQGVAGKSPQEQRAIQAVQDAKYDMKVDMRNLGGLSGGGTNGLKPGQSSGRVKPKAEAEVKGGASISNPFED